MTLNYLGLKNMLLKAAWVNIAVAVLVVALGIVTVARAESSTNTNKFEGNSGYGCVLMIDWLNDPQLIIEDESTISKCSLIEMVLLSSTDWQDYATKFNNAFGENSFPVLLSVSFGEAEWAKYATKRDADGNLLNDRLDDEKVRASAFSLADDALTNAIQFFSTTKDVKRFKAYRTLIQDWRNQMLDAGTYQLLRDQNRFEARTVRIFNLKLSSATETQLVLRCLLLADNLTSNFQEVVDSLRFRSCAQARQIK